MKNYSKVFGLEENKKRVSIEAGINQDVGSSGAFDLLFGIKTKILPLNSPLSIICNADYSGQYTDAPRSETRSEYRPFLV